ncbi:N-formylglutamate amidohydrolase [Coralliovum pocilloporae]|uniref:N-formylglutamate amidohydrolase n=1 Tax=Coralliovum pocilloporae TaxID=3066369 RepID=UPI0033073498
MANPIPLTPVPAFSLSEPGEQTNPVIFGSPHSGTHYPDTFIEQSRLDPMTLRSSEDAHVNHLFRHVTEQGSPLISARFPRAYVDLNREPYELDPRMFSDPLPPYVNKRSPRVASGLGTIPRIVSDRCEIYRRPLSFSDAQHRIETIYRPYHDRLRVLMTDTFARFGIAVLIDCHSMPSKIRGEPMQGRPDIIIGNRFGRSCASLLTEVALESLADLGYKTTLNKPYAGGFITEHYGKPAAGLHALQLEINRALYMDEQTLELHSGADKLARDLEILTADIITESALLERRISMAAE